MMIAAAAAAARIRVGFMGPPSGILRGMPAYRREKAAHSGRRNAIFRYPERVRRGMIDAEAMMGHPETIRGLERGLQVLEVLRVRPTCSLQELHEATGISKPSLLRILATL